MFWRYCGMANDLQLTIDGNWRARPEVCLLSRRQDYFYKCMVHCTSERLKVFRVFFFDAVLLQIEAM